MKLEKDEVSFMEKPIKIEIVKEEGEEEQVFHLTFFY